jgi:hypothetical protein
LEWSVIAFIGGIVFTNYDKSVTPLLLDATEEKIADYVSSKIIAAIASNAVAQIPETAQQAPIDAAIVASDAQNPESE